MQEDHSIAALCDAPAVSRSGYDAWAARKPGPRAESVPQVPARDCLTAAQAAANKSQATGSDSLRPSSHWPGWRQNEFTSVRLMDTLPASLD